MVNAAILFLACIAVIAIAGRFRNGWTGRSRDRLPTPRKCKFCGKKIIGNTKCTCDRGI